MSATKSGLPDALALTLVQQLRRLPVLDLHLEVLEEPLHLELEVELEVALAVDLLEEREHRGVHGFGGLKMMRILRGFEHLRDERDDGDHVPGLVRLQDQPFQSRGRASTPAGCARCVSCPSQDPRFLSSDRSPLFVFTLLELSSALMLLYEASRTSRNSPLSLSASEQTEVQRVKVGLDGRALHDEVHGEPRPLMRGDSRLDLGGFVVHVLRREVVHDEVHLVDVVRVGDGRCSGCDPRARGGSRG